MHKTVGQWEIQRACFWFTMVLIVVTTTLCAAQENLHGISMSRKLPWKTEISQDL